MELTKSSLKADITRIVEAQSYIATRQLVSSEAEQELLEDLLEASKPSYGQIEPDKALNYLLKTPFRYPPLQYGSRFGRRYDTGIFYGSLKLATALCEAAYYRFKFMQDSAAQLRPTIIDYTSFIAKINSSLSLNLTISPFTELKDKISSPTSYNFSQEIGSKAREQGFEAILYHSARDIDGMNVAVFTPKIFIHKNVSDMQHWNVYIDYNNVTFTQNKGKECFNFSIEDFFVGVGFGQVV